MADTQRRPNLSPAAHSYLERLGAGVEDLFHHVLAVLHDPAYREANAGALRMEWPRIPLPGWPDGDQDGAAAELAASAARGRELAALLDPDTPVPGVTEARPGAPSGSALRDIAAVAVPSTTDATNMTRRRLRPNGRLGTLRPGRPSCPARAAPSSAPTPHPSKPPSPTPTPQAIPTTPRASLPPRSYLKYVA